jgi:hypothetical protein
VQASGLVWSLYLPISNDHGFYSKKSEPYWGTKLKFIIAARPFNPKSQGCVLLHKLAHTLNKVGHEAAILFFSGHGSATQWYWATDPTYYCVEYINIAFSSASAFTRFKEDAVMIYPEVITGNPLGGNYVVRYMLNREGFIKSGVPMNSSHRDFILTHSYNYHKNPHFHLFNYNGSEFFNCNGTEEFYRRQVDLTYIGKGSKYTNCSLINGTQEVTRDWPKTKLELANLFKQTRYIYTWDVATATVMDAILCGVFPIYMTYAPFSKDEVYNLIDLEIRIPEVTYLESLSPLSIYKLKEMADFIGMTTKKIQESESNWEKNVYKFSLQLIEHFGL